MITLESFTLCLIRKMAHFCKDASQWRSVLLGGFSNLAWYDNSLWLVDTYIKNKKYFAKANEFKELKFALAMLGIRRKQ